MAEVGASTLAVSISYLNAYGAVQSDGLVGLLKNLRDVVREGARRLLGRGVEQDEPVVEAEEVARARGRAHHQHALAIHDGERRLHHRARRVPDDGDDAAADELLDGAPRGLGILAVVADVDLDRPPVDPASRVQLLDREHHARPRGDAEVIVTAGEARDEADPDRLLVLAGGESRAEEERGEEPGGTRVLAAWFRADR